MQDAALKPIPVRNTRTFPRRRRLFTVGRNLAACVERELVGNDMKIVRYVKNA